MEARAGGRAVEGMLEALGPSWTGLRLLKLSLKCFAMIQGGGSGRQRAEELALVLPVSLQPPPLVQIHQTPLVPTLYTKHEIFETVEVDLH